MAKLKEKERKSLTVSLNKKYRESMNEIVNRWNSKGDDIGSKVCESVISLEKLKKSHVFLELSNMVEYIENYLELIKDEEPDLDEAKIINEVLTKIVSINRIDLSKITMESIENSKKEKEQKNNRKRSSKKNTEEKVVKNEEVEEKNIETQEAALTEEIVNQEPILEESKEETAFIEESKEDKQKELIDIEDNQIEDNQVEVEDEEKIELNNDFIETEEVEEVEEVEEETEEVKDDITDDDFNNMIAGI